MRILAKSTLRAFWERHLNAEAPLLAWYRETEKADWDSPAQVKARSVLLARIRIVDYGMFPDILQVQRSLIESASFYLVIPCQQQFFRIRMSLPEGAQHTLREASMGEL